MKKLKIILLLFPTLFFAQNKIEKTIYFDSLWKESTASNSKYYRIVSKFPQVKLYEIKDYYKSGILLMEGHSKSKEFTDKEGEFTYYYENGQKKTSLTYSESKRRGKEIQWYKNGNQKIEIEYIDGDKKLISQYKINQFWDENGVQKTVDGNGFYDNENEKGELKNGFKEGVWEGSFLKPKFSYKEIYKNGKLISGESIDENNITYQYTELETSPRPKNGIENFYTYFGRNFKAPDVPDLNGKIYIKFVIDKKGKIVNPKIIRDLGHGTGEEAIRVLTNCENWIPGVQRGRKVRTSYTLPISIKTQSREPKYPDYDQDNYPNYPRQ